MINLDVAYWLLGSVPGSEGARLPAPQRQQPSLTTVEELTDLRQLRRRVDQTCASYAETEHFLDAFSSTLCVCPGVTQSDCLYVLSVDGVEPSTSPPPST